MVTFDDTNELLDEMKNVIEEDKPKQLQPIENKENLGKFDPTKTFKERLQRKTDKYVLTAREFSSRGASFLIAMLGVILQASHTSLLMYDISGFSSVFLRILVSVGFGVFISCALAVFTIKSDGKNATILQIINIFFYFEIFTNVFYYFNSLIFSKVDANFSFANVDSRNWLYLIVAMPFAFIGPFAIKQFSGIISADEKLQFGTVDGPPEVLVDLTSEQLEQLNKNTKNLNDLVNELETIKVKNDSYDDFGSELIKIKDSIKKDFVKRGETFTIDNDGKKTSMVIK
jgi:hypothetical protein